MEKNPMEPFSMKYPGEGILNSIEKQLALVRKLEDVYKNRPDPKNFVGAMEGTESANQYSSEEIQKDIDYVERTKGNIEKANKEKGLEVFSMLESGFSLSEMMQAMIIDRSNKGMLPGFKAIMTSERDDLKVGMDAILKKKEYGYLGASFDFTISSNKTTIQDKLKKIWENDVMKHSIPTVKYFEDPDTHARGSLMVPKFVIAGSKKDIEFFTHKYLEDKADELNEHPFRYMLVKQIDDQLKSALKFFEKNKENKSFDFIHKKYKEIQGFIEKLKQDINYSEYVNSKEFFEYKKDNNAYKAMKDFYSDK
ncbi:MAG: hypothetical protein KA515_02060 [Candidatus Pacebacteria bacterium]|jgi:hypothetical protein|nr:hypothetical protein [Candidatus Paceibacterota bacterium]